MDLLVFALESESPTVLVLITGDKDFTYAVSKLRMKGHDVYIIYPPGTRTHHGLKHLANGILDWDLVLGREGLLEFTHLSNNNSMQSDASRASLDQSKTLVEESAQLSIATTLPPKKGTLPTPLSAVMAKGKGIPEAEAQLCPSVNKGLQVPSGMSGSSMQSTHTGKTKAQCSSSRARSRTPQGRDVIVIDSSDDEWSPPGLNFHHAKKKQSTSTPESDLSDSSRPHERTNPSNYKPYESERMMQHTRDDKPFSDLITVLREQEVCGNSTTSLEDLERLLRRENPLVCEQSGVPGVRQYVELAQRAGIVLFSDIYWENKRGWIRLNSSFQLPRRQKPASKTSSDRYLHGDSGRHQLKTFNNSSRAPLRFAPGRRVAKPSEAHFTRLVELMQDLRIRGMCRIKDKKLFRMLRDEGLVDQRTYIEKAVSLGILYDKNRDGFLELHPDCC